jgi:phage shock protein A
MRLIQHTADLIVANLNHLLDRLEQPEAMLKHRLAKSEDQIRALSVLVARSIAAEQLLAKQVAEHRRRAERLLNQARRVLVAGDEAAARRALAERLEHERAADELAESLGQAARHNEQLRANLRQLQTRQALARQRFAGWRAKAQVYSLSCGSQAPAAAAALGRALEQCDTLWEQLERADCETEALIDLEPTDGSPWACDPRLDEELERLR